MINDLKSDIKNNKSSNSLIRDPQIKILPILFDHD